MSTWILDQANHFLLVQECFSQLERYQNVHLLQVGQIIREKGPWTNPVLQAILKDSQLPRDEVDRYLGSEVPVFFELRVRYLLSSEMFTEAVVLAKNCSQHPVAGRHLFFRQTYLTCLLKAALPHHMHEEVREQALVIRIPGFWIKGSAK
uniref:Uncharacterized protein n=1 Tax=Hucho hucho TaxID=62062 RepID=A0A4W5M429_9TELE